MKHQKEEMLQRNESLQIQQPVQEEEEANVMKQRLLKLQAQVTQEQSALERLQANARYQEISKCL